MNIVFRRFLKMNSMPSLLVLTALVVHLPRVTAEPISLASLLNEMTDRDALAKLDVETYTLGQFSSYDRSSVSPDDPKSWYANKDQSQFLRSEQISGRTEDVMMDVQGPGAIVRWWITMAGPHVGRGTIRVYLDGETEPTLEGNVYDLISRQTLAPAPLSESLSPDAEEGRRGHNLYLPIPYAKSCKVTFEREAEGAFYYAINYRTYGPDATVETFTLDQLAAQRPAVEALAQRLTQGVIIDLDETQTHEVAARTLAPGEEISLELTGPAAVRKLALRLGADDHNQALRSTALKIDFDGERSVWVPVGEFFGIGYRMTPHRSVVTQSDSQGTISATWIMPFEASAKITVINHGDQPVDVTAFTAHVGPWEWDERSLRFHATWFELRHMQTENGHRDRIGRDINFVTVTGGPGKLVGDNLTLYNAGLAWWGEGDEKIYIDGESFPSHFGTGTEDYYGYAWCRPEEFDHPFVVQPWGEGNHNQKCNGGYTVNSRWRGLDAIPFTSSLRFDMELWHWHQTTMNYAPATFFYARPGATHNIEPAVEAVRKPVAHTRLDLLGRHQVDLTIPASEMRIVRQSAGETVYAFDRGYRPWGRYEVRLGVAPDHAPDEIYLNGDRIVYGERLADISTANATEINAGFASLHREDRPHELRIVHAADTAKGFQYLRLSR